MAKTIHDLDDLLPLILNGLARTQPWQRQLAASLDDVDRLLVLRPTIALGRPDVEIVALRKPWPAAARAIRRGRL